MRKYSMVKVLAALCNNGYLNLDGVPKDIKSDALAKRLKTAGLAQHEVFYNYFKTVYLELYTYKPGKIKGLYQVLKETRVIGYYSVDYFEPKRLSDYVRAVFICTVHTLSNKERGLPECTQILDKCSSNVQRAIRNLGFDNDTEIKKFVAKPVEAVTLSDRCMKELMDAYSIRPRLGKLNTSLDYAKATWESGLMKLVDKGMYDRYRVNNLYKYNTFEGVARALDLSCNYTRHLIENYMHQNVLLYTGKHYRSMSAVDLCIVLDYLYVGSDLGACLGDWDAKLREMGVTSTESIEELVKQTGKSVNDTVDMIDEIFESIFTE